MACSDTRASDRSRTHRDTPALPFCHLVLKVRKPRDSAYPVTLETLGEHLRARRLDLKLHQREVAALLSVNEASVWTWENNRTKPELRFIPRITEFLGYSPFTLSHSIGERLRNCRLRMGLSQKELAKMLEVNESSIRNWESGRTHPTGRYLKLLGLFCGGGNPSASFMLSFWCNT